MSRRRANAASRGHENDSMNTSTHRSTRLRGLISQGVVIMPGAFNALSAKLIGREGFDAIYLSGAVVGHP